MRRCLVVVALIGCAPRAGTTPAWPKQHVADQDGGESIAPRAKPVSIAAQRVEEVKPVVAKPIVAPATTIGGSVEAPAPAVVAPVVQPSEETITTEDIVIEIDD